ncbi:UPF0357 protein, putative [Rhizoctonia solani AG-3 Rhs1AP]|uniref:UPF0357 protein, putative n=2 Tax=Rhizoctonia solani AG-3 TaxID=1086053 RepID=X8J404_9AGAM|nr:UPF0357 protein, putative [Rhizoctonia solani AG-3 Rhs1AP]KEP51593.1 putative UPF0357 protein [Rhizoctonia solani 123E]
MTELRSLSASSRQSAIPQPTATYIPHTTSQLGKMFYFYSVLSFLTLVALVAYYHRRTIAPHLPARMQHYIPLSSFEEQRDAGLTSAHFDIESLNILGGDSRSGLDEVGAAEVQRIMREEHVGFDEARLIRQKRYLAANGIDPNTGMPLDAKAVTRL